MKQRTNHGAEIDGRQTRGPRNVRGTIDADYIHPSLHPVIRSDKVKVAVETLTPLDIDAIAVRGMSGAIIGGAIAHALSIPIILVRKDKHSEETHHSCMHVEGPLNWSPLARYVIVDDFASSGNTLRRIQDAIGHRAELIGAYLYRDEEFTAIEDFVDRWRPCYEQPVTEPSPAIDYQGGPMSFLRPGSVKLDPATIASILAISADYKSTLL